MSDYKLTLQSHNSELQELINMANELPDKVEGVQLNFEVVGGLEQPANPTENMIWVNTDVAITDWSFSVSEPESVFNGLVWIATGTVSTVTFNILEQSSVQVYPIAAKQYISGAWVNKTAKIYQNAAWKDLSQGIIFDAELSGNETGGFTITKSAATYGTTTASATLQNDGTYLFTGGNGSQWFKCYATSKNTFDLSNFNTARITWTTKSANGSVVFLGVGFKTAQVDVSATAQKAGTYQTNIDISSLNEDSLYFYWGYGSQNQASVSWYLNKIELL